MTQEVLREKDRFSELSPPRFPAAFAEDGADVLQHFAVERDGELLRSTWANSAVAKN